MAKVRFSVNALHILELVHAKETEPGIIFDLVLIHSILQKVAERAIELNDEDMLGYMCRLHLVEVEEKEGGK